MRRVPLQLGPFVLGWIVLCCLGLSACQSQAATSPAEVEIEAPAAPSDWPSSNDSKTVPAPQATDRGTSTPDPTAIAASWQAGPHADTFVLDAGGQNNTCARCNAPINWRPSMADLPESCYACKFELEDAPPLISESEWVHIPCNVCHPVDRDDQIQPEIAWLEIAPLGEYAAVASPGELCLKCHAPAEVPGHGEVELGGAHAGYECTDCHSAHETTASCDAAGCHQDVVDPATRIPGHDEDHRNVTCVACHDASGMEVGPDEEQGLWTTFAAEPADGGAGRIAFPSHNVALQAPCERCHFADNPWSLSPEVAEP